MYAFDYRRPGSLNEADLALKAMPGAKLLAGGQTLIPALKLRLNRPEALIDLNAISSMRGISVKGGNLVVVIKRFTTLIFVEFSRPLLDDVGSTPAIVHRRFNLF